MNVLKKLNPVFLVTLFGILLFLSIGVFYPERLDSMAESAFAWTTTHFSGFYLLVALFFICFCLFLAFSTYGKIKLGKEEDQPEYSYYSWIGMLFSAGFGVALVFWGVSEPVSHYMDPPPGYEDQSLETVRVAIQYSMFHWGIHQWAIFAVIGLSIAYVQFRKGKKGRISASLEPLLSHMRGWRQAVDSLAVLATATGVATTLGLGVIQVSGGLHYTYNTPDGIGTELVIIALLLVCYLGATIIGLNKGIQVISFINLTLAFFLMFFIFFGGPTIYLFHTFIAGMGDYVHHFASMSLDVSPTEDSSWLDEWTIFYWAWAMAWSPFVGSFIARVSKGRTIREFVIGVMLVPPLVAVAWIAVFGGGALFFETEEGQPIAEEVREDVTYGLFALLDHIPFGGILTVLSIGLIFLFLITSAASATYVLGMMTSNDSLHPSRWKNIVWGVLIAAIATILLVAGGLEALQTASLVAALPFSVIMVLMCMALLKELRAK
ncbi:BCCT family transporter [Halalkalibacter sp. APA_J-10(15)]|uniref:BCCT family transporter n=1 Tax=unclassified Halalkalibacter TaxID=2893063 RepID=UPI001FF5C6C9|nr:BCCT family transporter [Halalkalibacter sp. APA_J-10(15)]MCK0473175.1 BCCT family transporter [Halalkalibacter sp. APA_J-10(15)]